jgi:magnesium-transporting ATPase (P-type)
MLSQIHQQAKDFASLTINSECKAFIQAQQNVFTQFSPSKKLRVFECYQKRNGRIVTDCC